MSCPSNVNNGFINLIGPIQTSELNSITDKDNPLYLSFVPRTTPPTIIDGNRIEESTANTCFYKGKWYILTSVQICSVIHNTFKLPGQTQQPVAELILSFNSSTSPTKLSEYNGILLCLPIYNSGNPSYNDYLDQMLDLSTISCNYTNESGSEYEGDSYKTLNNSSLIDCVRTCCDDTNCLAYTFKSGTCHLKKNIEVLNKNRELSIISGKINRGTILQSSCERKPNNNSSSSMVPTIQSLFYQSKNNTIQSSFAYNTCFEVITPTNEIQSKSIYVFYFPNGIHLTQSNYQNLILRINNTLKDYQVPPAIRGSFDNKTIFKYSMNDGTKIPTEISNVGVIYKSSISSCTEEFLKRFEYFTNPPKITSHSNSSTNLGNSPHLSRTLEQCDYYKTSEYKCVPFNQLTDLSGEYVIPGNNTMDKVLEKSDEVKKDQIKSTITLPSMEISDMEEIIGYVVGGSIILFIILFGVNKMLRK